MCCHRAMPSTQLVSFTTTLIIYKCMFNYEIFCLKKLSLEYKIPFYLAKHYKYRKTNAKWLYGHVLQHFLDDKTNLDKYRSKVKVTRSIAYLRGISVFSNMQSIHLKKKKTTLWIKNYPKCDLCRRPFSRCLPSSQMPGSRPPARSLPIQ